MSINYLAIDPGADTGWARFKDDTPQTMGIVEFSLGTDEDLLWGFLSKNMDIDVLVIENWRNRPVGMTKGHAGTWSENTESQIIGACRFACWEYKIEFVTQDSSIKPVGYGYAGMKYVKNKKGMHKEDAIAHGYYWWMEVGRHRES